MYATSAFEHAHNEHESRAGILAVEETIIEALDALEADRFWGHADATAKWRASLDGRNRAALVAREAVTDAAFGGKE